MREMKNLLEKNEIEHKNLIAVIENEKLKKVNSINGI